MQKTLLSLGHGYSAQALAERLLPQGWLFVPVAALGAWGVWAG